MEEELKASDESDEERGPDPGGGHGSPCPVEDMNSQHMVEEEPTASDESDEDRGPDHLFGI